LLQPPILGVGLAIEPPHGDDRAGDAQHKPSQQNDLDYLKRTHWSPRFLHTLGYAPHPGLVTGWWYGWLFGIPGQHDGGLTEVNCSIAGRSVAAARNKTARTMVKRTIVALSRRVMVLMHSLRLITPPAAAAAP
jgi:hypothetical protein